MPGSPRHPPQGLVGVEIGGRVGVHSHLQLVLVGAAASFRDGHFDMQNMRKVTIATGSALFTFVF